MKQTHRKMNQSWLTHLFVHPQMYLPPTKSLGGVDISVKWSAFITCISVINVAVSHAGSTFLILLHGNQIWG